MPVSLFDAIGLGGVLLILIAYALTVAERLDPLRPPALLLNLFGALGILVSLYGAFNLSAAVMEAVWGCVALAGLVRLALRAPPPRP